jgi:hypothetical protein
MAELNTLAPKKWPGDYSGNAPTLDITDGISIGDITIETGATNTGAIWRCLDNTDAAASWQLDSSTYYDIIVDLEGSGDALTIEAGIALAVSRSPGINQPMFIDIKAGVYTEAAMTVPSYVSIIGKTQAVYVKPTVATQTTFTMNSNTSLSFMTIQGNSGSGGIGVTTATGATTVSTDSITFVGCETAMRSTGAGAYITTALCAVIGIPGTTTIAAYHAEAGGTIYMVGCTALGVASSMITKGFFATGTDSRIFCQSITANICTDGAHSDDNADIELFGSEIRACTYGIRTGATGNARVHAWATDLEDNTSYDFYITNSTDHFGMFGGRFNVANTFVAAGAVARLSSFSSTPGSEGLITWGRTTADETRLTDSLVLPKASNNGLKVDINNPTFGWMDMLGSIVIRGAGGSDPTYNVYRDGIRAYEFSTGNEVWVEFHIPHDYVPGTDLFIHAHWSHHNASTQTTGSLTWDFETTYAKGHNQAAFPATVTPTVTHNAATTNVPQYQHMISEVQLSAASPSGTQLDSDDIEIDGLVLVRVDLSANTLGDNPFMHYADLHYQSTGMPTKQKAPDFYSDNDESSSSSSGP